MATELTERNRQPDQWDNWSLQWLQGITDALTWTLGERDLAPVSEAYTPGGPDAAALRTEDDAANEACLRPKIGGVSRHYANGAQHAVMWVRGETDDPPYDL